MVNAEILVPRPKAKASPSAASQRFLRVASKRSWSSAAASQDAQSGSSGVQNIA